MLPSINPTPARTTAALLLAAAALCVRPSPAHAEPLNPLDFPSLGTQTLAAGAYTINTSANPPTLGAFTGTVSPSGVAVFRFDTLVVQPGAVITANAGLITRPVALLSSGDLVLAGALNAVGNNGGAPSGSSGGLGGLGGAGSGGVGGNGGSNGSLGAYGGGHGGGFLGGFLVSYGVGGTFGGGGGGVAQGIGVQPNFALVGGSGGGGGGGGAVAGTSGGGGGGGGGAVELGALGTLSVAAGAISVAGGNGAASLHGNGAGGSGGAILLHAATVTVGGAVNATGGLSSGNGGTSGGGGGRIAIQARANPGTTGMSVAGGTGTFAGGAGVISFAQPVLTATSLDFGLVPVGSSVTLNLRIQNTGSAGSFINGLFPAASGPFARVGTGGGAFSGLAQNASTACSYTFAPSSPGGFAQALMFLSNAGPVSVTISGVGVPAIPNDSCSSAILITNGTRAFSTIGATTDGPTESTLGFCCGDLQVNQDVWFLYTATCTGAASVSLCGSNYDSKVAVYNGVACPTMPNTAIAGNDDSATCVGSSVQSYTTFACIAGNQYLIRVGGYTTGVGNAQMTVGCAAAPAPCAADFNHSGLVSVQDIFDFLAAYFAGC